jgi:GntP family gluconate:H+ symporter
VGIPALAGLSVLHGFVPPHPGPLAAIASLDADLGLTLAFGLLLAIPSVIIAGPVFGSVISRYVEATPRELLDRPPARVGSTGGGTGDAGARDAEGGDPTGRDLAGRDPGGQDPAGPGASRRIGGGAHGADADGDGLADRGDGRPLRRPAFAPTVATVLLPVVLMLVRAVGELTLDEDSGVRGVLDVIGNPVVALLAGVLVAMFTLGSASGMDRGRISGSVGGALPSIAGILLIVAAGGGFKQTLVDAGVGTVVADWAEGANISALVLGWLVAVGIRLATGSATVATITAAGIVAPLAQGLDRPDVALLVLAIGAGSLFFSHVNDAGFWLVKEYFGLTVGQTIKSWSVMETIISVVGLLGVLLLNLVV